MRENAHPDHFDLLPFIAILMCVLGCLLLVTVSMSALSMGLGADEEWIPVPQPAAAMKQPILAEWDGKEVIFHDAGGDVRLPWTKPDVQEISLGGDTLLIPRQKSEELNVEFFRYLEQLEKKKDSQYVLIAVRPEGFSSLNFFARDFRDKDIVIGYEPVGKGKLVKLNLTGVSSSARGGAIKLKG